MKNKKNISWEELTISNDFMFSKVMSDKDICRETLEILLDKKISKLTYVEEQKTLNITPNAKGVRLDVYIEDEKRIYNIEMQVGDTIDLPKRSRYYRSMIDLNAIQKGDEYDELKESIVIFICKFDPFKRDYPVYYFKNICILENEFIVLKDEVSTIFFNTLSYSKEKRENLKAFLEYIETNKISKNDFVEKIDKRILDIKSNKEWEAIYMKSLADKRDIEKKAREQGREEGKEEGIAIGLEQGREEGIAIGLEQAKIDKIKSFIKYFSESNMETDLIIDQLVKMCDISKEEAEEYLDMYNKGEL